MKTERERVKVEIELYKDQAAKFYALCYYLKSELGRKPENLVTSSDKSAEPLADVDFTSLKELFEEIPMAGCSPDVTLEFLMDCIHIPRIDVVRSSTAEAVDNNDIGEESKMSGIPSYEEVKQFISSMTGLKNRLLELDRTNGEADSKLDSLITMVIGEIQMGNIHIRRFDPFWYTASRIPPAHLPIPSEISLESFFEHQYSTKLDTYEFIDKLTHSDKVYIINKVYKNLLSNKILREFPYQTKILTGFVCSHILDGFCPFNQNEGKYKKSQATWKKELEKSVARLLEPDENLEAKHNIPQKK